jgi:putative transposase
MGLHYPAMNPIYFLLLCLAGWLSRNQQQAIQYLQEEVKVLKEQLGKRPRFTDNQRLKGIASIVSPRTLLQLHQRLIARKYDGSRRRGPGRPHTAADIRALILKMAQENRVWGYTRIQGALANLGHEVGRSTIANILKAAGIEPSPERRRGMTWKEFLKTHWEVLAAADFFTVEVWTAVGLVRYHILFVIRLATREVQIAGIIPEPHGRWMKQVARNLSDGLEGLLLGYRYLLHDRATLFSESFRMILRGAGIEPVRLPAKSPNLNAYAERFVRSIKEGCLAQMILIGEASLHRATENFLIHYHQERNHQALENKLIRPEFIPLPKEGDIKCRKRLGGLLRYYYRYRKAA